MSHRFQPYQSIVQVMAIMRDVHNDVTTHYLCHATQHITALSTVRGEEEGAAPARARLPQLQLTSINRILMHHSHRCDGSIHTLLSVHLVAVVRHMLEAGG